MTHRGQCRPPARAGAVITESQQPVIEANAWQRFPSPTTEARTTEEDQMLSDADITTLVTAKDLGEAMAFYEEKMKLVRTDESPGWVQYRSGTSNLIVYESEFAGSNKATTAVWTVNDVTETVRELKANGVTSFQQYDDLPGATRDGDIHTAGPVKMAWFKDPSGNIFEVNGRD